jgi:predicted RecA/RadA family phage recombinase
MATIFHQNAGDVIDWVAAADVLADDFIDVGGKLGIALNSGATGETISVKLTGVIKAAKAAEAQNAGQVVTANTTTNTVAIAGGDIAAAGVVIQDAASGDATALVRLNA